MADKMIEVISVKIMALMDQNGDGKVDEAECARGGEQIGPRYPQRLLRCACSPAERTAPTSRRLGDIESIQAAAESISNQLRSVWKELRRQQQRQTVGSDQPGGERRGRVLIARRWWKNFEEDADVRVI